MSLNSKLPVITCTVPLNVGVDKTSRGDSNQFFFVTVDNFILFTHTAAAQLKFLPGQRRWPASQRG